MVKKPMNFFILIMKQRKKFKLFIFEMPLWASQFYAIILRNNNIRGDKFD